MFNIAHQDEKVSGMCKSQQVTRWAISTISSEDTEKAQKAWQEHTKGRVTLRDGCSNEKVEEEAV